MGREPEEDGRGLIVIAAYSSFFPFPSGARGAPNSLPPSVGQSGAELGQVALCLQTMALTCAPCHDCSSVQVPFVREAEAD